MAVPERRHTIRPNSFLLAPSERDFPRVSSSGSDIGLSCVEDARAEAQGSVMLLDVLKRRVFFAVACAALLAGCRTGVPPVPIVGEPPSNMTGNRPPTIKLSADQLTVQAGGRLSLTAEVYDADNDRLTLKWSAPSGTFNNPTGSRTYWTAPGTPGSVILTFTADDGSGGVTTEKLTVTVTGS
jgi:hypothetical protein